MTTGLGPAEASDVQALMPGVENAVKFLGIFPEYKVLVGCNSKSNPALIEAVSTCIRRIGADLTVLVTEPPVRNRPTPRVVMEAAKSVDYFIQIGVGPGPHSRDFYTLLFDYGVSAGFVTMDENNLVEEIGTYPFEVWGEIHNRLKWKICKGEVDPGKMVQFHLTDDRGSDLRWSVKCPIDIGAWIGPEPLNAGSWAAHRPRVMHRAGFGAFFLTMGDLQYTATGRLFVDASNFLGETPEPLQLTLEKGRCTRIDGGELARRMWDLAIGDYRNGDRVRELAIAIHPKSNRPMPKYDPDVPVPVAPIPLISHGDFWIALGGDTGVGGVDPGAEDATALFAMAKSTTITVDGEAILDRGRLLILDDPELREAAAQYGDPDYLLSPASTNRTIEVED
jgi:hypothetical protein